jgi:hypothetical protein
MIEMVADGKPVSEGFMTELNRMVSSMDNRFKLVEIVLGHHYLNRQRTLLGAIEQTEAIVFNHETMATMDPGDRIKLLKVLYDEAANVNKYINGRPANQSPDLSAADPIRATEEQLARSKVSEIPLRIREGVRELVASHVVANAKTPAKPKLVPPTKKPKHKRKR